MADANFVMYIRAVDANLCQSRLFKFFAKVQPPTSGLWLAADHRYSVMASSSTGSNQVEVTKSFRHAG